MYDTYVKLESDEPSLLIVRRILHMSHPYISVVSDFFHSGIS